MIKKRLFVKIILVLALVALVGLVAARPEASFREAARFYLKIRGIKTETMSLPPYKIRFYQGGKPDAPAVVLLHGLGGDGLTSWMRLMPDLAGSYRVLAVDMLYGNLKKMYVPGYKLASDEQMVLTLMRRLGIERAWFVGLSVGGWVALKTALDHPDKVNGLVLIASAGLEGSLPDLDQLDFNNATDVRRFYKRLFYSPPPIPGFALDMQTEKMHASFDNLSKLLEKLKRPELQLDQELGRIKKPCLILWGENDEIISPAMAETLAEKIPGAQLVLLPECGHAVVWDQGGRMGREIEKFLDETAP